ncbi:MAG: type II toxin-antitoxin system VapC family toxin [Boseongicola sp. SB0670_bin_30]|nr:type II toxin-antitoxin system VapC family toxin [Boseongicola sp. SB0670_bin_30]
MKGFLLDADVVSLLSRPPRGEAGKFADWLEQRDQEGRVFLSVGAIHEIRKGIVLLEHKGATTKASALYSWLTDFVQDMPTGFSNLTSPLLKPPGMPRRGR